MAAELEGLIARHGATPRCIDLRNLAAPFCDGGAAYGHDSVAPLREAVADADAIVLVAPVYNYALNAAAKNLVELTGKAWTGKIVGFAAAAGGHGSYMSIMGVANSLMLDFRCLIVPRFVYATGSDFTDDGRCGERIADRLNELAATLVHLTAALRSAGPAPSLDGVRTGLQS